MDRFHTSIAWLMRLVLLCAVALAVLMQPTSALATSMAFALAAVVLTTARLRAPFYRGVATLTRWLAPRAMFLLFGVLLGGVIVCALLPSVVAAREKARRATWINSFFPHSGAHAGEVVYLSR